MNYGRLRDDALRLIGRYTNAGELYKLTYNQQMDYVNRIPSAVNSCLIELASSVRKIPATAVLYESDGEDFGRYRRYTLPGDCMEVKSGGVVDPTTRPGQSRFVRGIVIEYPDVLLVPASVTGDLLLEYYRRPQLLPENPSDDYPVDADVDVQLAIPYYVASELLMEDDPYRSESLKLRFEDKVERMSPKMYADVHSVVDVYGFNGWGEC